MMMTFSAPLDIGALRLSTVVGVLVGGSGSGVGFVGLVASAGFGGSVVVGRSV